MLDMVDFGLTSNDPCLTPAGNAVVGAMSEVHNLALYNALSTSGLLDDERVDFVQISRLFDAIADRPADYGFLVVDGDPCPGWDRCDPASWPTLDAGRTYVFGQWGHFNAGTRELIAQTVYDSVTSRWAANPGTVSISGTAAVGRRVTATVGPWSPAAILTYAWFVDGKAIKGATALTLTLPASTARKSLTVVVTSHRTGQADTAVTSAPVRVGKGSLDAPRPRISGAAKVGKVLKVRTGTWKPKAARAYTWYANGEAVRGATRSSIRLTPSLKGKKIAVRVTGRRDGYATTHVTSRPTRPVRR
ncbi:hypothetical protein [Aeromicrobium endophyticum]|uniref:Uncharacterized protein n=2 Tax=Aeromicrobium endophyticum TaxID=2292704 RepID=A0A371P8C2_9ACTN|nr:hypothetical protein DX116_00770 [Aeromicrobium endophyticum]